MSWKITVSLSRLMIQQISPIKVMLLAFVSFVNDTEIQENFFCCKELEAKGLSSVNCVGIYTDGAPRVVGCIRGFSSLV
jgi:hypothetical protein